MKFVQAVIGVCALLCASAGVAAPLQFTLSGFFQASFELDSNPTPTDFIPVYNTGFRSTAVSYGNDTPIIRDVFFYNLYPNSANVGGLFIGISQTGQDDVYLIGPQIYTGPESAPQFGVGSFTLTDYDKTKTAYLRITEAAPVPEAATWAMMMCGFGFIGGMLRRRAWRVDGRHARTSIFPARRYASQARPC